MSGFDTCLQILNFDFSFTQYLQPDTYILNKSYESNATHRDTSNGNVRRSES